MVSSRFANRLMLRGLLFVTILLVLFNEILIYYINKSSWQQINCKYDNCTRILLVADPQLIGDTFDRAAYLPLAKFDSDRYLKQTFEHAVSFTQPHIVCFLGDLLDEGSVASPEEFKSYVERFRSIYHANDTIRFKMFNAYMQTVHVPGDNDIGGENGEYISNLNVHRFEAGFTNEDVFDYDNRLRFFKINRMLLDFTNPDRDNNGYRLRIGVSHAPILIGGGPLLRSVLSELDPHVIFSAHWHESRIFIHPSTKVVKFYEPGIKTFDLKDLKMREHSYLEIMVPTASYRMGKAQIGLGYAVIENYELRYTVLWLPNRFIFLLMYVFWGLLALSALVVFKMMTRCPFRVAKRQHNYNRNIS